MNLYHHYISTMNFSEQFPTRCNIKKIVIESFFKSYFKLFFFLIHKFYNLYIQL